MPTQSSNPDPLASFRPLMPSFIRLVASVIVLLVVENVVLGFQGINQPIYGGTNITVSNLAILFIGLVVALVVLKFGTQFAAAFNDAYKSYRSFTPVLAYIFQIIGLWILYTVSSPIVTPYLGTTPWAYPLVFLLVALIPTMKVVVGVVQSFEGPGSKHSTHSIDN